MSPILAHHKAPVLSQTRLRQFQTSLSRGGGGKNQREIENYLSNHLDPYSFIEVSSLGR